VDVAILVDGSSSLTASEFLTAKTFVKDVVGTLDVANTSSRVAVVQFSSTVQTEISFVNGVTQAAVDAAVDAMVQLNRGTRTSDALNFLRDHVFTTAAGMRPAVAGVIRILVSLTDGLANTGFGPAVSAASLMESRNLSESFALGVLRGTDDERMITELRQLALNETANVFTTSSFGELSLELSGLVSRVCPTNPTPCPTPAPIDPPQPRECFGEDDSANCHSLVSSGQLSCSTHVQQQMCPQLCGLCTPSPTHPPTFVPSTIPTAVPTQEPSDAPTTLPPTVSPSVAPSSLPTFEPTGQPTVTVTAPPTAAPTFGCVGVDDHEHCYTAFAASPLPQCDDVLASGHPLGTLCPGHCPQFCTTTSAPTPCVQPDPGVCTRPVDVAILVDGSSSLTASEFLTAKTFVKDVVGTLDVANTSSRVAVVQFSSTVQTEISFVNGVTQAAVDAAVDAMVQLNRGTRTSDALNFLRDHVFTTAAGMRPAVAGVIRILVSLTDGLANTGFGPAVSAASLMESRNLSESFALGVLRGTDDERMITELRQLALNETANVFTTSSFGELSLELSGLVSRVCPTNPTPCPTPAPIDPPQPRECFGEDDSANCHSLVSSGQLSCSTHVQQQMCPQLCGLCTPSPTLPPTRPPSLSPSSAPTAQPTAFPTSGEPTAVPTPAPTVLETICVGQQSNGNLTCSCSTSSRPDCRTCAFSRAVDGTEVPGTCLACKNSKVLLRGECVDSQTCISLGYTVTGQGAFNLNCTCDDHPHLLSTQVIAERIQEQHNSSRLVFYPSCEAARFLCDTTPEVRVICRTTCTGVDQELCQV